MEKVYTSDTEPARGLVKRSLREIRNVLVDILAFPLERGYINAGESGFKSGYVYTFGDKSSEEIWATEMDYLMETAKTHEDLNAIGAKINYAKENNLKVNVWDYQFAVPKVMRRIYDVIGEPPRKGVRSQIKRSELKD